MADRSNRFHARLHCGREVGRQMFVHDGRINQLSNALLVSSRKQYEIVGIEAKVWGGPRNRFEEFRIRYHLVVGIDRFPCGTLCHD